MLGLLLSRTAGLALLSAAPVVALTSNCPNGQFYWSDKSCCLQSGGPTNPSSPPSGNSCPPNWYWHNPIGSCAPRSLPAPPTTCAGTHVWSSNDRCCREPSCPAGQFRYAPLSICLPTGGPLYNPPSPPAGSTCPPNWYWHSGKSCCVPTTSSLPSPPSCSNGQIWSAQDMCCHPLSCGSNQFWYAPLEICLPKGGPQNPPTPPAGSTCPTNWYWRSDKYVCVPTQSGLPSPPSCNNGQIWSPQDMACHVPSCGSNKFWYEPLQTCLKTGGPSNPPNPPSGSTCPPNWYWYTAKDCCAPKLPSLPNPPTCSGAYVWSVAEMACYPPDCGANKFWYEPLSTCLPKYAPRNPPTPPSGSQCPPNWYWYSSEDCCVPTQGNPPPTCSNYWVWSARDQCCHAPQCPPGQFWWDRRHTCLPTGGPPYSPPPSGTRCPTSGWSWSSHHGCCVPHNPPPPPPPSCPPNYSWAPEPCSCQPNNPQPSHAPYYRRAKRRDTSPCPRGLQACPVPGLFGGEYECLDTKHELESCGGCASLGKGKDCTAIAGAWNVGCEEGTCVVYTCARGYRVSASGDSCDTL